MLRCWEDGERIKISPQHKGPTAPDEPLVSIRTVYARLDPVELAGWCSSGVAYIEAWCRL
jgi:hypothetical protein